jgi:hypothetical protein
MKNRLTAFVIALLAVTILTTNLIYAATLTLTKIGSLDTTGKTYSEWWYSGVRPLLEGKVEASKTVTIKVDDKVETTKADIEGNWTYRLLYDQGDYNVTITSDSESINFKLYLGQGLPGITTETTQSTGPAVPTTGIEQTVALSLGAGFSLLALYFYFYESNRKHKAFEKNIVSEK